MVSFFHFSLQRSSMASLLFILLNPKSPAWPHMPPHFPPPTNSSTRWSPTLTVHTQLHLQVHRDSPSVPSFLPSSCQNPRSLKPHLRFPLLLGHSAWTPLSCCHILPGPHWSLCQMMQPCVHHDSLERSPIAAPDSV